jgi:hypothetical protein
MDAPAVDHNLPDVVVPQILSLRSELEQLLPAEWSDATLKVTIHYEENSVGTSHCLAPTGMEDEFVDLPTEIFNLTAEIERACRFAGQPWQALNVQAQRKPDGWEFAMRATPKAA